MKGFLQIVLLVFILNIFFGCKTATKKAKTIEDFIPKSTSIILKIEDFEAFTSDLYNNDVILEYKETKPYEYLQNNEFLKFIKPSSKSLLCISEAKNSSQITFISRQTEDLFSTDSIKNGATVTSSYQNHPIKKINFQEQNIYFTDKDSIFLASTSERILQQLLANQTNKDSILNKIIHLNNHQEVTAYIPATAVKTAQLPLNFASWMAIDLEILPEGITASGVVLASDSVPQLISVFKGLKPQAHEVSKVTPLEAIEIISFTYDDFEILQSNLQHYRGAREISIEESILFESISEIAKIRFTQGNAIVLKSIDTELTSDALDSFRTEKDAYKNVKVYHFNNSHLFTNYFLSFTGKNAPTSVFKLGHYFIFSENESISQTIINAYLNNNTLSETPYYKDTNGHLSDESSLQIARLDGNYSNTLSNLLKTDIEKLTLKKYPLAILQFSYDRNFSHVNFVCKEAITSKKLNPSGKVSQIVSITLDNDLLNEPLFFSNHRTGGKDIIAQDITNKLYFISANGKTLWTRNLNGPILGEIEEVDILRNGKKQLAFATKNKVYVIDRTGRDVGKFPINFKDDITQALAVFDYDGNRKYRFLITQDNELLMLDTKGKRVKGFKFKKTKTPIVLKPKHIRVSGKDYLLIAEKSGKLSILNRVGNPRLNIAKTFNFSNIPIALEGNKIVVITKDNTKHSISLNQKVSSLKLDVTSYWFTIEGKTKVTLDDNLMRINGKLAELPFGIYTKPKIITFKNIVYVSITETQENKVYLFNKSGNLLPGFPVFGTSPIDVSDANKNGKPNFITRGDRDEILLFEF